MTDETQNVTVEERLVRVETKTDRLIKDVGDTRTDLKELRDVVVANDKSLRNDMKDMELRLTAKQDATTITLREEMQGIATGLRDEMQGIATGLRDEMRATVSKFDAQLLKVTELVADTKGQFKMLILIMVPIMLAASGYLFKLFSG